MKTDAENTLDTKKPTVNNINGIVLTSMSDIYNANVGDKIVLDKCTTIVADVYAEVIENKKWASVLDHLINDTYVVEIIDPTTIKNKEITNQIISSNFYGVEEEGKMVLLIPDHINMSSLKSSLQTKTEGYSFNPFEEYLVITKKKSVVDAKSIMKGFNTGDTKSISKSDCKNVKSTTSALYRMANKSGISVTVKSSRHKLVITHNGLIDTTEPYMSFTAQLNEWLNTMPYDLTVNIPARFIDIKSLAYINTVVNKSKFNCKCRAGRITKMSSCLKKANGTIHVYVKETLVRVINKPSLTNIDSRDRKLINLALKPFVLTYEDVR